MIHYPLHLIPGYRWTLQLYRCKKY